MTTMLSTIKMTVLADPDYKYEVVALQTDQQDQVITLLYVETRTTATPHNHRHPLAMSFGSYEELKQVAQAMLKVANILEGEDK